LLFNNEKILLAKHLIDGQELWAPPGGGLNFGESIDTALKREFLEETSLDIVPGKFCFFTEHLATPLHAIELFYKIRSYAGQLSLGKDPEIKDQVVLNELMFVGPAELALIPEEKRHLCLKSCTYPIELLDKRGQLK
jgi:8-oxo-dGTP diphosphatase